MPNILALALSFSDVTGTLCFENGRNNYLRVTDENSRTGRVKLLEMMRK